MDKWSKVKASANLILCIVIKPNICKNGPPLQMEELHGVDLVPGYKNVHVHVCSMFTLNYS